MKYLFWLLVLFPLSGLTAPLSTYDQLIQSKTCKDSHNQLNCTYSAGKTLIIDIAGIGQSDASILFTKSDLYGDYYGKVGVLHGCVIANKSQDFDFAFISPKNGKVYKDWRECMAGN